MNIFFSLRTSYKKLLWCTNDPNLHLHTFRKCWSFIWGGLLPLCILMWWQTYIYKLTNLCKPGFFNKQRFWNFINLRMYGGGSRATATSKMECFVIIVNSFQPLTIITKRSILDVAAVLDPPLMCIFSKAWRQ